MKTILAPIDFSPSTELVISAALELVRATSGRLVLLHVIQPPILTSDYGFAMENFEEAIVWSEKHAAKRLAELSERSKTVASEVISEQTSGAAPREILAAAERHRADYIVMGSHGHTALYDLLVGTTTHSVLRKVHCPVVIVPSPERTAPQRPS